jgi:raffinose/stachyose/melibiose transport system permease protein
MSSPKVIPSVQHTTMPYPMLDNLAKRARRFIAAFLLDAVALIVVSIVFVVPFIFIFLTGSKTSEEAGLFQFTWPTQFHLIENIRDVLAVGDNRMFRALLNSTLITVCSVALIVLLSALVAYAMQRRSDRTASVIGTFLLAGLIIPPAVVPTIFVLQSIGLYKTIFGLIMIEVAYTMPFATLIFRTFMGSIPREIDEAAIVDGASPLRIFFSVIFPLLRPAMVTVIVVISVAIFNDFTGPLYFLPGAQNVTVQLTLFGFISQFGSQWNLLFADVIIITIPPLIIFMLFQRQLVSGLTAGAIRG